MNINWTAIIGGTILTAAIGAVPVVAHASAPDVIVTAKVREHPDNGHGSPAHWATDSFTRTMRIHATGPNTFELTTTDTGTFTTIKGAGRPAGHGGTISRIVTGAFAGSGKGTATGNLFAHPEDLSGRTFDDVHGTPFPGSGAWANEFFAAGATVSPFGESYKFSYKTADEKWVDASDNGDGTDPAAGDITGKLSSLLVINPCHSRSTTGWKVTNARGDRSRTFTYWSYYKGQKSAGAKATVAPGATVTLHTARSTTLGMHYYDGYGVSKWSWVRCP